MSGTAIVFPGQGSLTADAAEQARAAWPELVDRAGELAGDDPFGRAGEGTRYAQPAIYVASLAGWRERAVPPRDVCAMAGHSLGELSALVAAGALSWQDGLELVVLRGRLMEEAAADGPGGGMVALLGGEIALVERLARDHGLTLANDNAPGEAVLSGERDKLPELVAAARLQGFKALVLDVAGAFHSPAMAAAERPFREALRRVQWRDTGVPVVSGLSARPFEEIPFELAQALVRPVRWREVMATLGGLGAREFVDVGPGRVLAKLAKRNAATRDGHVVVA